MHWNNITIRTFDGEDFKINPDILTACCRIDGVKDWSRFPMDTTNGATFRKVYQWCEYCLQYPKLSYNCPTEDWERRNLKRAEFETEFFDLEEGMLINLMQAAEHFAIESLLDSTCKKAAASLRSGSLNSAIDLSLSIQAQIAIHILPNALKEMIDNGKLKVTPSQKEHNRIWTSLFKDDLYFRCIFNLGIDVNPILIGKDLGQGEMYLVFSNMDTSGKLASYLPMLINSLRADDPDNNTWECSIHGSKNILNISGSQVSARVSLVPDLKTRILQTNEGSATRTRVMYLKGDCIHDYASQRDDIDGEIEILTKDCANPYNGRNLSSWICKDSVALKNRT